MISRFFGKPISFLFGVSRAAAGPILLGALGGFPIGAVCIRELYQKDAITKSEAEHLLSFTNNAGPAFCIGTVGMSFFGSPGFGVKLYICQLAAALIIGIVSRGSPDKGVSAIHPTTQASLSNIITKSISDSGLTMLKICSFAVFFAVIGDVICLVCRHYFGSVVCSVCASLIELTLGVRHCAAIGGYAGKLLCGFAIGFSGFSVHMQTASVISDCRLSMGRYYIAKLIQGLLCMLLLSASDMVFSIGR